ncbi:hypothetical protein JCM1840_003923 [Sporobolomyces johnsonii]
MDSKEDQQLPQPAAFSPREPHRRTKQLALLFAVVVLGLIRCTGWVGNEIWTAVTHPRTGVFWAPCPDVTDTFCSTLRVPLDYINPKASETVSLALRMLPAAVPPKEQLGYLFINPGGPGGSGTAAVVEYGNQLSVVVEGRYNIISWDPRGVNLTAPALGCFSSMGEANQFLRDIEHLGLPYDARGSPSLGFTPNASAAAELSWTTRFDAFAQALQGACDANADKGIMRASSTAFTARDMKSIAEALGEEKVNYWGFSYGTILGATFAAMFPDHVHRFILDGVSDSVAYTNNFWDWGRAGMVDTRKTYEGFLASCAESGPSGCAFAKENSTAASLEKRIEALYEKLRMAPHPVGVSALGPGIVTASDVQYTIFHALYSPKTWPHMAQLLASLEAGNGTAMYETAGKWTKDLARKSPFKNPFHRSMETSMASGVVVMCGDTDPEVIRKDTSVETLWKYMRSLREDTRSPTADMWSIWISQCRHWCAEPIETYRGPWTVEDGLKKTAYPMVLFSQTADPVTPLSAARKMAEGFGRDSATLLVQNGFGHCSLAHPSLCTAKKARAYLLDGVVPAYNTTCDADPGFLFPRPEPEEVGVLTIEDQRLRTALHELAERAGQWKMGSW